MSSYISISKEKKFVNLVLVSTFIIMSVIFVFNLFINPYGESAIKISNINKNNIIELDTKEKMKLLDKKEFSYNSFVIGSSQSSRIYAEDLDIYTNYQWITFPLGSSMASEQYYYIKYLAKNKNIKQIIYGIDDSNLFGKFLFKGNTLKKDKNIINYLDYFTLDTIAKSFAKIKYNLQSEPDILKQKKSKLDFFNGWPDKNLTSKELTISLNSVKPYIERELSTREIKYIQKIQNEFKEKIIPVITFVHPYSMLMRGEKNYYKFVNETIDIFGSVWHINPKYINEILLPSYYIDKTHTSRKAGKRIIKSIYGQDDFFIQINKNNANEIINNIFVKVCKMDFTKYSYSGMINCDNK